MRVNATKAFEAFLCGKSAKPAQSIWTDGDRLWSYGTVLAQRLNDGTIVFNRTGYSTTTTVHQNALAAAFKAALDGGTIPALKVIESGIERGAWTLT